jgi:predicted DNA-binding protein (UPF0251 family)/transcription elongation factor Elf1
MAEFIVDRPPVRCNVAQQIKTKAFLHEYRCLNCGRTQIQKASVAKRTKKCVHCKSRTHGMSVNGKTHPLYQAWADMRSRCNNPNHQNYAYYGGCGITVCSQWSEFSQFQSWASRSGYAIGLQIDRINPELGYSPENCRFITQQENLQNRRATNLDIESVQRMRFLHQEGIRQTAIASMFNVSVSTVNGIIKQRSWKNS